MMWCSSIGLMVRDDFTARLRAFGASSAKLASDSARASASARTSNSAMGSDPARTSTISDTVFPFQKKRLPSVLIPPQRAAVTVGSLFMGAESCCHSSIAYFAPERSDTELDVRKTHVTHELRAVVAEYEHR